LLPYKPQILCYCRITNPSKTKTVYDLQDNYLASLLSIHRFFLFLFIFKFFQQNQSCVGFARWLHSVFIFNSSLLLVPVYIQILSAEPKLYFICKITAYPCPLQCAIVYYTKLYQQNQFCSERSKMRGFYWFARELNGIWIMNLALLSVWLYMCMYYLNNKRESP